MSLHFQSLCSSSSANCLTLWSEKSRILVDCGLSSMKRTRQALSHRFGHPAKVDAVLLTHIHTDHISYYPLRVFEECGRTIHLHEDCVDPLKEKHFRDYGFRGLNLKPFKSRAFTVGEFSIQPFEVCHNPSTPTRGFQINGEGKKIVIVTDFNEWESVFEHFLDADFIFVESNHDLELLRQYYNPNSRFHMPNPRTGELLLNAVRQSKKGPSTVMLGHISSQRNEPDLALAETVKVFREAGQDLEFELLAAPLRTSSAVIDL